MNTQGMVATATRLTDHVVPDLPLQQWVLTVPKRLRYLPQRDVDLQGAALRLFVCMRRRVGSQPPASPRAATLASVRARKRPDQRAEQPVATANRRLTRPIGSSTLRLARLK